MLKHKKHKGCSNLVRAALLTAISCSTIHSLVFADTKSKAAEDYRDLGLIEQKKGNMPDALNYFIKAIELGLESSIVFNDIGVIYEQIGVPSKAEQYYLQAVANDKNYLPPYLNLAYLYLDNRQDELAFQYFKKRFERSQTGDPWAAKAKEELLKIHPEFITWIVTEEAKRLDKELVMKAHEEFANRINRASEHFQRGQEHALAGRFTQAFTEYDQALALTPNNPKIQEAKRELKIQRAKEEFERRSEHAIRMLEQGNTYSAKEAVQNMLATIPNE